MKTHRPLGKHGFTLVELLVTVTIIIFIAALALSGFSRLRKSGDRSTAMRNLSQLQLANISYPQDHGGQFVPVSEFNDTGGVYVAWMDNPDFLAFLKGDAASRYADGKVDRTLPISLMDPATVRAKRNEYDKLRANFGFNDHGLPGGTWGQPNTKRSFRGSQLTSPERTAAFMTATDWNVNYGARFRWQGAEAVEGASTNQKTAYRHNDKALVVYYDGHLEQISMADMGRFDSLGGSNNIFWKGDAR